MSDRTTAREIVERQHIAFMRALPAYMQLIAFLSENHAKAVQLSLKTFDPPPQDTP